jgi:hypothetical protein
MNGALLSGALFVAMLKPAHFRQFDNFPKFCSWMLVTCRKDGS